MGNKKLKVGELGGDVGEMRGEKSHFKAKALPGAEPLKGEQ